MNENKYPIIDVELLTKKIDAKIAELDREDAIVSGTGGNALFKEEKIMTKDYEFIDFLVGKYNERNVSLSPEVRTIIESVSMDATKMYIYRLFGKEFIPAVDTDTTDTSPSFEEIIKMLSSVPPFASPDFSVIRNVLFDFDFVPSEIINFCGKPASSSFVIPKDIHYLIKRDWKYLDNDKLPIEKISITGQEKLASFFEKERIFARKLGHFRPIILVVPDFDDGLKYAEAYAKALNTEIDYLKEVNSPDHYMTNAIGCAFEKNNHGLVLDRYSASKVLVVNSDSYSSGAKYFISLLARNKKLENEYFGDFTIKNPIVIITTDKTNLPDNILGVCAASTFEVKNNYSDEDMITIARELLEEIGKETGVLAAFPNDVLVKIVNSTLSKGRLEIKAALEELIISD